MGPVDGERRAPVNQNLIRWNYLSSYVAGSPARITYTDPWGAPKDIDRFFRWNIPDFAYSFDASFVGYFGPEGVDAVNEAI